MKTKLITLSVIVAGLIFVGCSSTSNDEVLNDEVPNENIVNERSTISGTVPGTLIEAFCDDGSYYVVNSTDNNTSYHPFEIEIPTALNCRLVMTTNEDNEALKVITPIGIVTADGNGTLFTASEDIDLGHIDLAMSRDDINDTNNDGVSDDILFLNINGNELVYIELENDPTDSDNDGLLNIYEDDDSDGINNHDDNDDDNDGIEDSNDFDHDNDGINDNDFDGDGVTNDEDEDDDNDGIKDDEDDDDDNDGIRDDDDLDDDNDGIDDVNEEDGSSNDANDNEMNDDDSSNDANDNDMNDDDNDDSNDANDDDTNDDD